MRLPISQPMLFSAALHAAILLLSALMSAALGATEPAAIEAPDVGALVLAAMADAPPEPSYTPPPSEPGDRDEGAPPRTKCGDRGGGTMGEPSAPTADHRYGVRGPADNPDPHVARDAGVGQWPWPIGIRPEPMYGGDERSPKAPWGRDGSLGNDRESARAGMWGEAIGMSFGSPGIGMGREDLCDRCGDSGGGRATDSGTRSGGPTGTEAYGLWLLTARAR